MQSRVYEELLRVAGQQGVEIIEGCLQTGSIKGLYINDRGKGFVALNEQLHSNLEDKAFTLAHELGHHALHSNKGDLINNHSREFEEQADNYAIQLIANIKNNIVQTADL